MEHASIQERIALVSIASLARWSRAAEHHARRKERRAALACAERVTEILDRYGWEHLQPGCVVVGPNGRAIHKYTRQGARGAWYVRRLRADGTVTKERPEASASWGWE